MELMDCDGEELNHQEESLETEDEEEEIEQNQSEELLVQEEMPKEQEKDTNLLPKIFADENVPQGVAMAFVECVRQATNASGVRK